MDSQHLAPGHEPRHDDLWGHLSSHHDPHMDTAEAPSVSGALFSWMHSRKWRHCARSGFSIAMEGVVTLPLRIERGNLEPI